MATDGGGGGAGRVTALNRYWSLVPTPKPGYFFVLANFHFAAILAISTYTKPNI